MPQTPFLHQHHDIPAPQHPIKEDLSRMEGEYGAKMLGKLKQMNVCVIGLNGLGIETCKNLILAGIATISVYDQTTVTIQDLGANFYVTEQDVTNKTKRSAAVLKQLASLNPNVQVIELQQISIELFDRYDVVVLCDHTPIQQVIAYNNYCHNNNKTTFIYAQINGVTGFVFSDFGASFDIFDADGLPNKSIIIDHITQTTNGQGLVTIDGERHLLNTGDLIKFDEIRGMNDDTMHTTEEITYKVTDTITDINQICEIQTTKNPKQFLIGDISKLNKYNGGGLGTQVKKPVTLHFSALEHTLYKPTFNEQYFDFSKFGRNEQLHLARLAVWQFQQQTSHLPRLHSIDDANTVLQYAQQLNDKYKFVDEIDTNVVKNVSLYYQTELTAFAALFGGIVAQEVTKHTGKYTPIQQWMHYDAFELLLSQDSVPTDAQPQNSRYDHQISIFGAAIQHKIEQQNLFLVGCGALGCEYLKSIALTGLGCNGGTVHITDDDRIELSNLSRQFLFRRQHVGKPKSVSAGNAAIEMNHTLKNALKIHEIRVEPKTEDTFDDNFWSGLNFVLNALDNMQARQYVDSQCVWYEKPLFESGTLGTQANSVVCIPHKTPSYSEGAVAGEDQGIAKCTLRNFPSDVVHCIEYAREKFDDLFVSGADNANSYIKDNQAFLQKIKSDPLQQIDTLKSVKQWLELNSHPTPELCVQLIYTEFITTYRDAILDLITAFPADARIIERHTKADLGPFWHGHKRFPQPVTQFDPNNPLHVDYIYHGTNIMTQVFGLPELSREQVIQIASKIQPPVWKYSGNVTVEDEKAVKDGDAISSSEILPETSNDTNMSNGVQAANELASKPDDTVVINELTQQLQSLLPTAQRHSLHPQDFEKDDDTNHHVDWITAATNLRAWNYQLKPATKQKTRMTAGKIIPAIATTTACITGFILIEIYKYICNQPLENYRAASINLGTNTYVCENLPDPIRKKSGMDQQTYMEVKAIPEGFTTWDHITIKAPGCTLQEFIDLFKQQHHDCDIDMLATSSGQVLYNAMDLYGAPEKKQDMEQRLNTKLIDLFTTIAGPVFPSNRTVLQLDCTVETPEGETGIVPKIRYVFA